MDECPDEQGDEAASRSKSGQLINVEVGGTDVLGIGTAVKTPAAKAIASAVARFLDAFSGPLGTYLQGHAETSVAARRTVKMAEAEEKARLLNEATRDQECELSASVNEEMRSLGQRAARRLLVDEIRKQSNFEEAVTEATSIADSEERAKAGAREIPDDWMQLWAEGAHGASTSEVRSIFARILAQKATQTTIDVGAPSLRLLKELDGEFAKKFELLAAFLSHYGCYPVHGGVTSPNVLLERDVQILIELGFLKHVQAKSFRFREANFTLGGISTFGIMLHDCIVLTRRAADLANAMWAGRSYSDNWVKRPDDKEFYEYMSSVARSIYVVGPQPIRVDFQVTMDGTLKYMSYLAGTGHAYEFQEFMNDILKVVPRINNVQVAIAKALFEVTNNFQILPAGSQ